MIERANINITQWLTFLWVIGLASWGGVVSYLYRVEKNKLVFSIFRLSAEMTTAAFVGVITYLLCSAAHISPETTAAFVGLSGHMGTRALFILEKKYEAYFGTK